MAKLNSGTRIYGTANVDTQINLGANVVANTIGVYPASNTVGTELGNTLSRWVVSANTGNFSGLITGTAGVTITGQVNASTGFGSGTINATSNGLFANATTISLGNSTVNVAITPSTIDIGTSFDANTTGLYHTGTVNAASISIGSGSFIANATAVVIADPLTANGTTGTAAQVLTSNGTVGSPYWSTISSGGSVTATDDTTTAASRYLLFANQTSGTVTAAYVSSTKLTYNPSTGKLTATSVTSSSDERLKTNIVTIDNPLDAVKQLRGVSFNRIDSGLKDYGVIAQEIEQVIPDVVDTDEEGYKSVSYSSIIGFLIEGMKHQQSKIEVLESKIENLLKK